MNTLVTLAFLAAVVRWTMPLVLAATGGLMSERSGVINIALEGFMIAGAFAGACGAYYGHGALAGIVTGVLAGAVLGLLYALFVVKLGADAIVVGVAMNLLAEGLSRYLLKLVFGSASNSKRLTGVSDAFASSSLAQLVLNPLVIATVLLVIAVHFMLGRTRFGLRLRAAGDHPEAVRSLGVDVAGVRLRAVVLSGALAGLGGVWMVIALGGYTSDMIGGRGYIALAALIFGRWRPLPVLAAALLFGLSNALAVQLRLLPAVLRVVPEGYLLLLPYLLTIVALAGGFAWSRRTGPPAALGRASQEVGEGAP